MAKYINNLDLNNLQLLNAVIQNLAVPPSNPKEGSIYYDTANKKLKWYNGHEWINADSSDAKASVEDIVNKINESELKIDKDNVTGLADLENNVNERLGKIESENTDLSNKIGTSVDNAKKYTDEEITKAINTIVGGAGDAYDTLGELQKFIEGHQGEIDKLLNATHKHTQLIGDGTSTEYTVTHNLNTRDVSVSSYQNGQPYEEYLFNVYRVNDNEVKLVAARAIKKDEFRVVVIG